jgi:hypothetical protein
MSEELYPFLRVLHIIAGGLCLLLGPAAMLTLKGGRWHLLWGRIFFWSMFAVALSAALMTFIHPNQFLLLIAGFSFYLAFMGYRAVRLRRSGGSGTALDWLVGLVAMVASLLLLGEALRDIQRGAFDPGLVFGPLGLLLSGSELLRLREPEPQRGGWWRRHIIGMLAAYIAAVSAFSVVNMTFLPPLVAWLWPTALGTPLIAWSVRRYRPRYERKA